MEAWLYCVCRILRWPLFLSLLAEHRTTELLWCISIFITLEKLQFFFLKMPLPEVKAWHKNAFTRNMFVSSLQAFRHAKAKTWEFKRCFTCHVFKQIVEGFSSLYYYTSTALTQGKYCAACPSLENMDREISHDP